MHCEIVDLIEYEQHINDYITSSLRPSIPPEFLPETAQNHPMLWVELPRGEVEVFSDCQVRSDFDLRAALLGKERDVVYFPIYPLQRDKYRGRKIIKSGTMRISASYRTVFYDPDSEGPMEFKLNPGERLMVKLHIDGELPGIAGDRSLTRDKVEKCVAISRELERLYIMNRLSPSLKIIREEAGLVHKNRGAVFKRIPGRLLIPGFALYSRDHRFPEREPLIVRMLRDDRGLSGEEAAQLFGDMFAKPLVTGLFSAFREGFSLEMHQQNILIEFDKNCQIKQIYYRDFEGVVFSNLLRKSMGLPELFEGNSNPELHMYDNKMRSYFNRNLDFDLGRIWMNLINALQDVGYFGTKETRVAVRSVRHAVRSAVRHYGLGRFAFLGRFLRFASTPYGDWYSADHYIRCRFR